MEFVSLATQLDKIVDHRFLILHVDFYELTEEQEKNLAEDYICFCKDLLENHFYAGWFTGRFILDVKADKILKRKPAQSFGFEAFAKSDLVNDRCSFRSFRRKLYDPRRIGHSNDMSADYMEITEKYWKKPVDPEKCKQNILDIFAMPGKIYKGYWNQWDASGYFGSSKLWRNASGFCGDLDFRVSISCLGDAFDAYSEKMRAFAMELSKRYVNISARVFVFADGDYPYKSIYGKTAVFKDGSHLDSGCDPSIWYKHYYVRGAEWFNILSPLQQKHFKNLSEKVKDYETILHEVLPGGGVSVWLNKPLSQIDVGDLSPMKDLLYDGIQPGTCEILLDKLYDLGRFGYLFKPRRWWEPFPLFDDEVFVLEDRVVFKHRAYPLDLNALK